MVRMFWDKLKKPFFVLAPMHEVTDAAFRQVVAHYSKPDVIFTEFVSVDGLCHPKSQKKIVDYYLKYDDSQRPIVAQIWGSNPENFYKASQYVVSLGFDGIDINMGCPDKSVVKQGGGAALIQTPELAAEIIGAAKEGAGDLPISVKTRIGFDKIIIESWIEKLIKAKPSAITIHGRTKKELSKVPTHWDKIGLAASIAKGSGIKIIGNGDISSLKEGSEIAKKYGLDGIMVGRAVMGNPWFFNPDIDYENVSLEQKIEALLFHAQLFEKIFSGINPVRNNYSSDGANAQPVFGKSADYSHETFKISNGVKRFNHFKKHIKAYISGFKRASELRVKLMQAKDSKELELILKSNAVIRRSNL